MPLTTEQLAEAYSDPTPARVRALAEHCQWLEDRILAKERHAARAEQEKAKLYVKVLELRRQLEEQRALNRARNLR